jgi:hypothetical protein
VPILSGPTESCLTLLFDARTQGERVIVYYVSMNSPSSSGDIQPLVDRPEASDEPLTWEAMRQRADSGQLLGKQRIARGLGA